MERDISEVFDNNLSVFRRSEKSVVTIGRDPSNDIAVYGFGVSARHAELRFIDEGMSIHDCKSHSGVKVNGEEIQGESEITSGCRIDIGIVSLKVTFDSKECRVERTEFPSVQEHRQSASDKSFTIGRSKDNDIVLDHPLVSRYHCEIKRQKDKPLLKDLGSTNGTFVNGKPCKRCEIHENDMLHIGHFRFSIKNGRPVESDIDRNIHIQASDLTVQYGETRILDRVSLSVRPGEFSVVLGPSGSGKTTLARAIAGIIPRSGGGVYYNGLSMRRFRKVFHSHIGFVSQNILLRDNLKVSETLEEQAVLKLPTDSTPLERKAKIQNVLEELDIKDLYDKRISSLSGGQARRVHLAIELLSSPDVIFLDEPLAGLDSGLIDKFMKLFRELSRKGKTVVITTHTLERLEDADKVIFVNYGRVVYN
ncbi:MAG: FHA domain-containing protein, partial [Chitinivibrionales bacterium]